MLFFIRLFRSAKQSPVRYFTLRHIGNYSFFPVPAFADQGHPGLAMYGRLIIESTYTNEFLQVIL